MIRGAYRGGKTFASAGSVTLRRSTSGGRATAGVYTAKPLAPSSRRKPGSRGRTPPFIHEAPAFAG